MSDSDFNLTLAADCVTQVKRKPNLLLESSKKEERIARGAAKNRQNACDTIFLRRHPEIASVRACKSLLPQWTLCFGRRSIWIFGLVSGGTCPCSDPRY